MVLIRLSLIFANIGAIEGVRELLVEALFKRETTNLCPFVYYSGLKNRCNV